jgi:hypothetical protein
VANSASGAVPVVLIRGGITKADFKTAAALQRLGDEGDDAWRDERAADPLNCLRIDAKPSGYLAHTGPSRSRQRPFSSAEATGRHPRRFRSSWSPVTAARTRLTAILPPEVAEAGRRKFGIANRVLDVLVPQPCLQRVQRLSASPSRFRLRNQQSQTTFRKMTRGRNELNLMQEATMAGGTKPTSGTRRAEKFQDGAKKSGGIGTTRHAGPCRANKPQPVGTKGSQLQRQTRRRLMGREAHCSRWPLDSAWHAARDTGPAPKGNGTWSVSDKVSSSQSSHFRSGAEVFPNPKARAAPLPRRGRARRRTQQTTRRRRRAAQPLRP